MWKLPKTGLIGGIAFIAAVTLGVAAIWQPRFESAWLAGSAGGDPSDISRRQKELQFLKGAFDRLEAEAKQNPNGPTLRSLRTEQNAVVERMREVAGPVPRERLPNDLRVLLGGDPATIATGGAEKPAQNELRPAAPPVVAPAAPAVSTMSPGELKPGLASAAPAPGLVLSRDPGLSGVVLIARPRPPRPAAEASQQKPGERQPSSVNANDDPKPPVRAQSTMRSSEKNAPSGASGAAERSAFESGALPGR